MIRIVLVGTKGEDLDLFLSMANGSKSLNVVGVFGNGQEAAQHLLALGADWKVFADQVACEDTSPEVGGVELLTTLRESGVQIPLLFCPVADLVRYL